MEIKINNITHSTIIYVETNESDCPNYIRYGKDCWIQRMGESDEPLYDCEWIEELFQEEICK